MTQFTSVRARPSAESRLIAGVCAAHLMSHYYLLMLAPLLAFVRADFNVSYTQLALALTVFNVVSGVLQTPVGFLVDRIGARYILIAGLALSSAAFAIAGLFNSYWVFIAMYGVAGLGNTVYHPADYSLLSHHSPPERLGQIFAFHTFAGMLGSAIAPVSLLAMQSYFGWRGAYIGAAIFGLIVLAVLLAQPEPAPEHRRAGRTAGKGNSSAVGWQLLISPAILLNLAFFASDLAHGQWAQYLSCGRAWRLACNAARDRQPRAHQSARHERRRRLSRRHACGPDPPACADRSRGSDHRRHGDGADRDIRSSFGCADWVDRIERLLRRHHLSLA